MQKQQWASQKWLQSDWSTKVHLKCTPWPPPRLIPSNMPAYFSSICKESITDFQNSLFVLFRVQDYFWNIPSLANSSLCSRFESVTSIGSWCFLISLQCKRISSLLILFSCMHLCHFPSSLTSIKLSKYEHYSLEENSTAGKKFWE